MVRVWIDDGEVHLRPASCKDHPLPMGGLGDSFRHRRLQMTAAS